MVKTPGQVGYEAYREASNGQDMPTWSDLEKTDVGLQTKLCWEIAAAAIASFGVPTDPPTKVVGHFGQDWGILPTE